MADANPISEKPTCEKCHQVWHITCSGKVCRCGVFPASKDDRESLICKGATWSESPADHSVSPSWKPSQKKYESGGRVLLIGGECPDCDGNGYLDCDKCKGTGEEWECEDCGGSGESECDHCGSTIDCESCDGEGCHECEKCDGDGNIDCETCSGTGIVQDDAND